MTRHRALGLVETEGLVAGIEAADAMVKAAPVELVGKEVTVAKLVTIKVVGETGAVHASVAAGVAAAERVGTVFSSHVIPRPHADVEKMTYAGAEDESAEAPAESGDLDVLTVAELRRMARIKPEIGVSGREISRASKRDLIAMIRSLEN